MKTQFEKTGSRIETVLNGLLVAVIVGAVAWAAVGPSLLPLITQA